MTLKKSGSSSTPLREVVQRDYSRDAPGLMAQLRDSDPAQRRWAARDLAGQVGAAAALGERLFQERDESVREALFTALSGIDDEGAVNALLPLLRSEDPGLRNGAIEALGSMPRAVGPRILTLLKDPDSDVRIFTVNLLGELKHDLVPQWLVTVLQSEAQINVVAAAIEVLTEVGAQEHVPVLRAVRKRFADDAFIGFAVELAIERIEAL